IVNPKDEKPLPYQPWVPPPIMPSYSKEIFLYLVRCLLQPNIVPTDIHCK
uniref:Uncharacterized protein n=1 Tax=Cebus imitator TaxID=2715852 RepID=A0A2K5RX85_CEBIM